MQIEAYAKLNWYLDIVGKRPDGYHLLDMVNQRLALHDTLDIVVDQELSLSTIGDDDVPAGCDNLVLRAAHVLANATGCKRGARIILNKRIPSGAGLGGGSADAAAALLSLNALWNTGLDQEHLQMLGATLGADIPYCLIGGQKRVQGIGEKISHLHTAVPFYPMIILKPDASLSTKAVFAAYRDSDPVPVLDADAFVTALAQGDFVSIRGAFANRLQSAAARLAPEIGKAIELFYKHGAIFAQMTGSGSAVYGIYASKEKRNAAMHVLKRHSGSCIATETIDY